MTPTRSVDEAAFGVVYGSVTVLALLMAMHLPIDDPGHQALVLFLSVFAVAIAKAYAEICERALHSGQATTWQDIKEVWHHSQTVLLAANGPTVAFVLAALGVVSTDFAFLMAQLLAIGLLAYFGARIGWRISGRISGAAFGAGVTSGLALLVSLLKLTAH